MLKNMEKLQEIPFQTYRDRIFTRLGEISKVANLSEEDRLQYYDYLKWSRDYYSELDYERNEGRKEGEAQGRAEGLAQGMAQGMAKGREEEKRELAANLKALGVDTATIAKASGLTPADIEAL